MESWLLALFGLVAALFGSPAAGQEEEAVKPPTDWQVKGVSRALDDPDESLHGAVWHWIGESTWDDPRIADRLLKNPDSLEPEGTFVGALMVQAQSRAKDWPRWESIAEKLATSPPEDFFSTLVREGGAAREWVRQRARVTAEGALNAEATALVSSDSWKDEESAEFVAAIRQVSPRQVVVLSNAVRNLVDKARPLIPTLLELAVAQPPTEDSGKALDALATWGARVRPGDPEARGWLLRAAREGSFADDAPGRFLRASLEYVGGGDPGAAREILRAALAANPPNINKEGMHLAALLGREIDPIAEQFLPVLAKDLATTQELWAAFFEGRNTRSRWTTALWRFRTFDPRAGANHLPNSWLKHLRENPPPIMFPEASLHRVIPARAERIPALKEVCLQWLRRTEPHARRWAIDIAEGLRAPGAELVREILQVAEQGDEKTASDAWDAIEQLYTPGGPVAELLDTRHAALPADSPVRERIEDVWIAKKIDRPAARAKLRQRALEAAGEEEDAVPWHRVLAWFPGDREVWQAWRKKFGKLGQSEADDGELEAAALMWVLDSPARQDFMAELVRWTQPPNPIDPFILGALAEKTDRPFPTELVLALLDGSIRTRAYTTYQLAGAHMCASEEDHVLVRWLGGRSEEHQPWGEITGQKTRRALLEELAPYVAKTKPYTAVRAELAELVARLVREGSWGKEDRDFLGDLEKGCREAGAMPQASDIARHAEPDPLREWLRNSGWTLLAHAGFWVLLLLVYPHSRPVQHLFFSNNWLRKIAGLGYVDVLLRLVPAFRRRLFAPFRESLVPRAETDAFDSASYFAESEVLTPQPLPARTRKARVIFVPLGGQHVLIAASGLGKTTLLRALVAEHTRPVVFLRATECAEGPLQAIQMRLQGKAQEGPFLTGLVYAGGLDVFIDGLNEVGAATRERIRAFLAENFAGNFLVTTQRIAEELPRNAQLHELRPLRRDQVADFLLRQWPHVEARARERGVAREAYEAQARELAASLPGEDVEPGLGAAVAGLRNPLDGVLAAERLACGEKPDLTRMIDQHVQRMDDGFYHVYGRRFPWERFAEAVLAWREDDSAPLALEGFEAETRALQQARLILPLDGKGWRFRHDRIMEHFLVHAFLGAHAMRQQELAADSRFVGVYRLLPRHLEKAAREELRRWLSDQAAKADEFLPAFRAFAQGWDELLAVAPSTG